MVDDGQHGDLSGLDCLGERPSRRPLIVDEDRAIVASQVLGVVEPDEIDTQQLDQRDVLLVADFPSVVNIDPDVKERADKLVGVGRGDGVRIREILKHDQVMLASMGLQQLCQHRSGCWARILCRILRLRRDLW